jgi:hypothetical protein
MDGPLSLGPHRARQVGDLLELEFHGAITRDDAVRLHDHMARMLDSGGGCYLVCDLTHVSSITPDARRYMSEWNRTRRADAAAVHGASFGVRAMVTLLLNALKLLGREGPTLMFFRDAAEARRWLDARRAARPT